MRCHQLLTLRFGEGPPILAITKRQEVDADVLQHAYPEAREVFKRARKDVVRKLHDGPVDQKCERPLPLPA